MIPLEIILQASPLEICQLLQSQEPLWPQQSCTAGRGAQAGAEGPRAHTLWKVPALFLSFATYEDIFFGRGERDVKTKNVDTN